jgi:hypothetical protein
MVDWNAIEKLSRLSTYRVDYDRLEYLEANENEFTQAEYWVIVEQLKDNLLDPITSGMNYNQTDILKHLKKLK